MEKRLETSNRILTQYPDRVPVIIYDQPNRFKLNFNPKKNKNVIPPIKKNKYLAPREMTVGAFTYELRKNIELPPEMALFIFIGDGILPPTTSLMSDIYERYHDREDNFLYMTYAPEDTFG